MRATRQFQQIIGIVLLLSVVPSTAAVCSCVRHPTAKLRDLAAHVFVGVVREASELRNGAGHQAQMEVVESFKGSPVGARVSVTTPPSLGMCGIPFQPQERYLIFAYGQDPLQLSTDACAGSRALNEAAGELKFLRRGAPTNRER